MALAGMAVAAPMQAQNFLLNPYGHAAGMKALQPSSWQGGFVTSTITLTQNYRYEVNRQRLPAGNSVYNFGNGKGINYTVSKRVEFDTVLPNYVEHNDGKTADGFGDYSFTSKARLFSGNESHGNYMVSAMAQQTFSTGQAKNGAVSATRVYTLLGGKGFGSFNVQSTVGVTVPAAAGVASLGHPVAWNTMFQDRLLKKLWVNMESNTTFYNGGSHDGKKQSYLTPGVIAAGLRPRGWSETDHKSFTVGAGMQIATTHYRASDHNLIMDAKFAF